MRDSNIIQVIVNVPSLAFEISDLQWQFLYATIWKTIDSFDDVGPAKGSGPFSPNAERALARVTSTLVIDKKKDKGDIHVNVSVAKAVLVTTTNGEKLGQFSINEIQVNVDMEGKTDAMRVDGRIGSAILTDVRANAAPLYQTILAPKDKTREMIVFSYESRGDKPHLSSVEPGQEGEWDSSFIMMFRKVEIVAMVGFILTVKDLVLVPIFTRLDLEDARAREKVAKSNSPGPTKLLSMHTCTYMYNDFLIGLIELLLKVEVESPTVLLPSSPTKKDMLIAELGHFSLANHYVIKSSTDYIHVVTGYPKKYCILLFYALTLSTEIRAMNMKSTRGGLTEQALNDVEISLALDFPSSKLMNQKVNQTKHQRFSLMKKKKIDKCQYTKAGVCPKRSGVAFSLSDYIGINSEYGHT